MTAAKQRGQRGRYADREDHNRFRDPETGADDQTSAVGTPTARITTRNRSSPTKRTTFPRRRWYADREDHNIADRLLTGKLRSSSAVGTPTARITTTRPDELLHHSRPARSVRRPRGSQLEWCRVSPALGDGQRGRYADREDHNERGEGTAPGGAAQRGRYADREDHNPRQAAARQREGRRQRGRYADREDHNMPRAKVTEFWRAASAVVRRPRGSRQRGTALTGGPICQRGRYADREDHDVDGGAVRLVLDAERGRYADREDHNLDCDNVDTVVFASAVGTPTARITTSRSSRGTLPEGVASAGGTPTARITTGQLGRRNHRHVQRGRYADREDERTGRRCRSAGSRRCQRGRYADREDEQQNPYVAAGALSPRQRGRYADREDHNSVR